MILLYLEVRIDSNLLLFEVSPLLLWANFVDMLTSYLRSPMVWFQFTSHKQHVSSRCVILGLLHVCMCGLLYFLTHTSG